MTNLTDLNDTEHIKKLKKETENPIHSVMSKEISDESQKGMDRANAANIEEMFDGMKKAVSPAPQRFLENVSYPRQASLIAYDLTPESQGNIGSCTSQAVTGTIQNKYARKTGRKTNFAESYLWWRQGERPNTLHSAQTAAKYWMVLSDYWGYYAKEGKPGWEQHKIATGKNVRELANLEEMKAEIAAGNPVVFSFSADFSNFAPNGYVDPSRTRITGAHAVQVSAYNDDTQTFTCRNSWGNHGDKGYLHFPYSYVTSGAFWVNFVCFDRDLLIKDDVIPPAPPKPISHDVTLKVDLVRTFENSGDGNKTYYEYNWILEGAGVSDVKSWRESEFRYTFPRRAKPERAVDMSKESKDFIQTSASGWQVGKIIVTFNDGFELPLPLFFPKA